MKDTGWKLKDGAEAGLQCRRPPAINHHHLMDQLRIFMGQEGAKRHSEARKDKGFVIIFKIGNG